MRGRRVIPPFLEKCTRQKAVAFQRVHLISSKPTFTLAWKVAHTRRTALPIDSSRSRILAKQDGNDGCRRNCRADSQF